jgi:peptidyl-prolyl cis-trans isomerase-like 4
MGVWVYGSLSVFGLGEQTSLGDIVIDLQVKKAPKASLNFIKLCKIKYYNYSLFHTLNKNFTIQAGAPAVTSDDDLKEAGDCVWG